MRLNIKGMSQVKCSSCGRWLDWHVYHATSGNTGVGIAVEPCRECGARAYFDGVATEMKSNVKHSTTTADVEDR